MPLITTAAIAALYPFLIELAKKSAEKVVDTSSEKLTEGSIDWLKSLFFKNNEPKNALKELIDAPEDKERQNVIKAIIENSIEDNPENDKFLKEILNKVPKTETSIYKSKNVNTGDVNTQGGNFRIGDDYGV
ncbi:hypothetical protein HIO71_13970 [Chryseobacterium aquaticum]|jgi:hypothetical protein|uniref:Uncharacterized protein n=3 Tax=Chryseobacterium TaxID=59732 RepID=A0A848N9R8_9FLAO|nr:MULTISPECIES: hypothetical protein [Chryseobacterium]MDV3993886.1 hypothetical protein [Elizabethkingia anophelis]AZA79676.1 hypothetical protein EG347_20395 [Chryseobacterium sp. G0186]AZB35723.1 hypothetical protein EG351_20455 [Chryseobacterium bernardetii]EFK35926.1 hypothetical protein HMPREF0204_14995 [Chryseobacterium gleum ATCC 35910]NMR35290.1 hypothetical protein [Chryseobacterium aquaticum]